MRLPFRRKGVATPAPAPAAAQPITVAPQPGPAVASPPGRPAPPTAPTAVQPQAPAGAPVAPLAGTPAANAAEIENLRAWVAQLDRRVGTRTYIAAAMTVLAVAAAAVAIVLAVDARDNSASDDDLNAIESEFSGVAEQAAIGAGAQAEIDALEARIAELESGASGTATDPESPGVPAPVGEAEVPPPPVDEVPPEDEAESPANDGAKRNAGVP